MDYDLGFTTDGSGIHSAHKATQGPYQYFKSMQMCEQSIAVLALRK